MNNVTAKEKILKSDHKLSEIAKSDVSIDYGEEMAGTGESGSDHDQLISKINDSPQKEQVLSLEKEISELNQQLDALKKEKDELSKANQLEISKLLSNTESK